MCGRFALQKPVSELGSVLGFQERPNLDARFNIAPTEEILVVRKKDTSSPKACWAGWGLKLFKEGARPLINARGETAATLPTFRQAFRNSRCLIPASGYYEWLSQGQKKEAYFIEPKEGDLLVFAGLLSEQPNKNWPNPLRAVIMTTSANEDLCFLHDRMPVILQKDAWDLWLDAEASLDQLQNILRPVEKGKLRFSLKGPPKKIGVQGKVKEEKMGRLF